MPNLKVSVKSENILNKWWVLATLGFGLILPMLDFAVVSVAASTIREAFQANFNNFQWIMGAYLTAFAVVILGSGVLGDIYGRKKVYALGLLFFVAGSAISAVSDNINMLLVGRVIAGLGGGFIFANTLSIAANAFKPKDRAVALASWAGISAFALAIGPVIGGLLVENFGWQWAFWVNVPIGVFALVLSLGILKENKKSKEQLDLLGLMLGSLSLVTLMYAVIQSTSLGWGSFYVVGSLLLSLILGWIFVANERRTKSPLIDVNLFKDETFSVVNLTGLVASLALFGLTFYIAFYFQQILGYSVLKTGLSLLPLTAFVFMLAPAARTLSGKYAGRWVVGPALVTGAVGCLLLSVYVNTSASYAQIVAPLALIGISLGVVLSPLTVMALGSVADGKAGGASGIINTTRAIGAAIGVGLLGTLLAYGASNNIPAQLKNSGSLPEGADQAVKQIVGTNIVQFNETITSLPKQYSEPIYKAIDNATAYGLERVLYVTAALLLISAVLTVIFVKDEDKFEFKQLVKKIKSSLSLSKDFNYKA